MVFGMDYNKSCVKMTIYAPDIEIFNIEKMSFSKFSDRKSYSNHYRFEYD